MRVETLVNRSGCQIIVANQSNLPPQQELVEDMLAIILLLALIGVNNSHTISLGKLEGDKFECANLYGKRLVVISDSERYGATLVVGIFHKIILLL